MESQHTKGNKFYIEEERLGFPDVWELVTILFDEGQAFNFARDRCSSRNRRTRVRVIRTLAEFSGDIDG